MALDNIQFLGHVSDPERSALMARARMVIVAALEDYGLVPIEANNQAVPPWWHLGLVACWIPRFPD